MKKKTKKKLKILLWLLVLGACASFWAMPVHVLPRPARYWHAPVQTVFPSLSTKPVLDEATRVLEEMKKQTLLFEEVTQPEESQPLPVPESPAPVPPSSGEGGLIALIIDDMGMTPSVEARVLRFPDAVTLSYLPYAPHVQKQVDQAKAQGHDVLLHCPMEPVGKADPGPDALRVGQTPQMWAELIEKNLNKFSGYCGVNNHMGSRFTRDQKGMEAVAEALHQKGVFFVDSRTNPASVAEKVMQEAGVQTISRDVFLDDTPSLPAIRGELARLERAARRQGVAVAIGHPHLVTIQALESWFPEAEKRGFRFVPVREVLR